MLKGFFYGDSDDEVTSTPRVAPRTKAPAQTATVSNATYVAPTFRPDTAAVSTSSSGEMRSKLKKEVDTAFNNSPYYMYQKQNNEFKAVLPDLSQRGAALAISVKGLGLDKAKILGSTTEVQKFLDSELSQFSGFINKSLNDLDQNLQNRTQSILASISDKQKAIVNLTSEIATLQSEKQAIEAETVQKKGDLDNSCKSFTAAHNEIITELNKDVSEITAYLGA